MFLLWELMTLSAFFLVIFDNTIESIKAGIKYFLMSEVGALCMLVAIIVIHFSEGTVDMETLASRGITVSSSLTHILLAITSIGPAFRSDDKSGHLYDDKNILAYLFS